ncbi:YegS/Rv2252/BmrU family lipid kinase (plasmid) [Rhodococcus opacus]|uniref:diacylglycerol/lipid kinase family protein n=1 Tax=Rhodococcus opacus TaxID=37919 RepID=UPI0034D26B93
MTDSPKLAVIAHRKKQLGEGLGRLREALTEAGFEDPIWYEVPKSKKTPKKVHRAMREGAELLLIWGGDGTVQRCLDALMSEGSADRRIAVGILPAGTANLLATNLGIPIDLDGALEVALHGDQKDLDVGTFNGEHFAVMAGVGFDALLIRDADSVMKDRFGRLAYLWTGARATRARLVRAHIAIDGDDWFDGKVSCVLVANVGTVTGGLTAFPGAVPDDGRFDVGVVTAVGMWDWIKVFLRLLLGQVHSSPLVRTTTARHIDVRLDSKLRYELDGGDRKKTTRMNVQVKPRALTLRVPSSQVRSAGRSGHRQE